MKLQLNTKQLKFISSSTDSKDIRPVLANIYYNPDEKVLVSTDSYRLHTIAMDLGYEPLWFDKKGELLTETKGFRFPDYKSFFPNTPNKYIFSRYVIDQYKAFSMVRVTKTTMEYSIKRFGEVGSRTLSGAVIDEGFNDKFLFDFAVNPSHLNDATKDMKSCMIHLGSTHLAPIVFTGLIDSMDCKALVMPMKI